MKLLIITFIIFFAVAAFADEWHEGQSMHYTGEFAITVGTYKTLTDGFKVSKWKALGTSVATSLTVGLIKELFIDSKFGEKDMLVNVAGTASGVLFVYVIEF